MEDNGHTGASKTRELECVCLCVQERERERERETCKKFRFFHGMDSVINSHMMTPKLNTSDLLKKKEFYYYSKIFHMNITQLPAPKEC
jgi:hypothetical protein